MKKYYILILTALLMLCLAVGVMADSNEADYTSTNVTAEGFDYPQYITDEKEKTYADTEGFDNSTITLSNENGIAHVYVIFDKVYGEWTLTEPQSGKAVTVGKNGFLHEYIDVAALFGKAPRSLVLSFDNDAYVADVYGFTEGQLPDWVQRWEAPLEKADILLLSSHSDDEQLFFAGILPYYAGERDVDVQVVYLISHFDTHDRPHEQLNGLWTVGVRNYPVISDFPDLFSESLDGAIAAFKAKGYSYEDFTAFIVENIRRFKPQVLITHDIEGEYGHGTHIYCTDVVMNALPSTVDPSFYPESAEKWGTWDVPKTYLHLYEENQITMDWDTPLSSFDGKTAFEMTVEGFECHKSQHWTWFYDWIYGTERRPVTKAGDIKDYSPCLYGLYRTNVGVDVKGGDFLENIIPYKDQIPPETTPPETEAAPESTTASETEVIKSEKKKNSTFNPLIFIVILIMVSVIIIVIYFAMINDKKRRRPKSNRNMRR